MFGVIITAIPTLACFILTVVLWRRLQHRKGALPRLVVVTGVVREMRTEHMLTKSGGRKGQTTVNVDFVVAGVTYVCRDLWIFADNNHVGDVGTKYDLPPGHGVGVFYDPADPRLCALIVDLPRHYPSIVAGLSGAMFGVLLVLAWGQFRP